MRKALRFFIYLLIIFTTSLLLISCFESQPIPQDKLVRLYAKMIIMQDTSSLSQAEIRKKVLSDFNFSESDYKETIKVYNSDPDKWKSFFDEVTAYIESLKPKPKRVER